VEEERGEEAEVVVVAWRELRGRALALAAAAEERAALARRIEAALEVCPRPPPPRPAPFFHRVVFIFFIFF
jgi:hypothetical protein